MQARANLATHGDFRSGTESLPKIAASRFIDLPPHIVFELSVPEIPEPIESVAGVLQARSSAPVMSRASR
jgi:hypothetical protein